MDWAQVLFIVFPIILAVIVGIIYNNRRIDDLRSDMSQRFADINQRFAEMIQMMNQRFADMNQRFVDLNQRFADMNQRFADMNQRFLDMNQRLLELKSELKADIGEVRRLLVDALRREVEYQKVADR